jgi:hypothetical protein
VLFPRWLRLALDFAGLALFIAFLPLTCHPFPDIASRGQSRA